ncbi:MAG: CpsD/CapB family tyrosine-protein kinase, partial [Eubacterium sp.]|nr:CpsD/CapB family tyrosine-protein kinase [Eubacterium sp.]
MRIKFEKVTKLDYALRESYNTLRTNLQFCGDDIKVVMLTSCTPNEGKSTIGFNLCRLLAEDEKRVLFLDADIRKSVLVGRHGVSIQENNKNKKKQEILGLSHYFTGQASLEDVICETNIERFDIVFSGPVVPNPTELLGNKYFEDMVSKCRDSYDYVIIDAPPLGSVIDGAIVSPVCDGAV